MYFIDMYDKVMCAVVASALVCIPGDSCIASAYFVGLRTNFREIDGSSVSESPCIYY